MNRLREVFIQKRFNYRSDQIWILQQRLSKPWQEASRRGRSQMMGEWPKKKRARDNRPCTRTKNDEMSVTLNLTDWLEGEDVQAQLEALKAAPTLPAIVCIALQIGLMLGRWVVEAELAERAAKAHPWPECPNCGKRLQSKGWYRRQMGTLVGEVG